MRTDSINAAGELFARRTEALRLFRALSTQAEMYRHPAREILCRGGNRSGKTTICATMFAALAMDKEIETETGEMIRVRRPHQRGRPLLMWVIGYQQKHIGQTIHRMLFRPGAFKMLRDKGGIWRSYRPWVKEDHKNCDEVKLAPPLIPPRYINKDSWTWENKGEHVFTGVEIIDPQTGETTANIHAYTSTGEPKAGDPVDIIWIDEHIAYAKHYAEWQARIIDTEGRIIWSSWPRTSNNALMQLSERAKEADESGDDTVKEFVFTMSGNPFLSTKAKQEALSGWDDDEKRARDTGEFMTDNLLIYPSFNKYTHSAISPDPDHEDEISKILRDENGQPPADWTRELVVDPGTAKPAVLFGAIPPPHLGDFLVVYDEIYIPRLDAEQLADVIRQKVPGQYFNRFIIDWRAARQKPMGMGHTVGEAYSRAFEKRNIKCHETGFQFIAGSDDFPSRSALVQEALAYRRDQTTQLRIVTARCPNLVKQMESNVKTLEGDEVADKPARGQKDDMRVALEYWLSRNPIYVDPPEGSMVDSPAYAYWKKLSARKAARSSDEEKSSEDAVYIGM